MKFRMLSALAAAVLVVGLATACTPSDSPSPSPTPTFSTEAEAFAAAEATYRAYVDALNQVDLSDPETFEPVYDWTTGDANAGEKKSLTGMHADGWTVNGESRVVEFDGVSLDRASGSVSAHACLDVTAVDLRDSSGESVVSVDRPGVQSVVVSLEAFSQTPTGLVIADLEGDDSICS